MLGLLDTHLCIMSEKERESKKKKNAIEDNDYDEDDKVT